jgi:hypothetical protein
MELGPQFHEMTQDEFARQPLTFFHSTVHGMIDPAGTGFHVGTRRVAEEVLRNRLVSSRTHGPNSNAGPAEMGARRAEAERLGALPLHELVDLARRDPDLVNAVGHNDRYPEGHDAPADTWVYTSDPRVVAGRIVGPMATPHELGHEDVTGSGDPHEMVFDDDTANDLAANGTLRRTGRGVYYANRYEGGTGGGVSAVLPHRSHFMTHEDYLARAMAQNKGIPERAFEGYTEIPGQGRLF